MSEEYLIHYGVLGMKWGVHKSGDSYRYTSRSTKSYSKKADKYAAKASKTADAYKKQKYTDKSKTNAKKAKISQQLDDKMLKSVKKTGLATTVAAVGDITGTTKTYQMYKATNTKKASPISKNKKENFVDDSGAVVKAYLTGVGANFVGNTAVTGATTAAVAAVAGSKMSAAGAITVASMVSTPALYVAAPAANAAARKAIRTNYINRNM